MSKSIRVAVNKVVAGDETVSPCVLEFKDGKVVDYYHLTGEQPFTAWKGGTVVLSKTCEGWNIDNISAEDLLH